MKRIDYDDFICYDRERDVWQAKKWKNEVLFEGTNKEVLSFLNTRQAEKVKP